MPVRREGGRLRRAWKWTAMVLGVFFLLSGLEALLPHRGEAYTVLREETSSEPVASGVSLQRFLQQTDEGPLKIFVLRLDLTNPYVRLEALTGADNRSFTESTTVLEMSHRTGAVAAINGDFFITKEGKHPLGFTVQDGQLVTSPMLRSDFYSFALTGQLAPVIDLFSFAGTVTVNPAVGGIPASFPLAGINKPPYDLVVNGVVYNADTDRLHLYDSHWGALSRGAQPGYTGWTEVVVKDGVVQEVAVDQPPVPIPQNGYVLSGEGAAARFLQENCVPGARVSLDYGVTPCNGEIETAVGGQDLLVANGRPTGIYSKEQNGKFARSAVGFTRDGKILYLVAVEKSGESRGIYLQELADFLANRLGVWRALNLDGGGSTSLVVRPLGEEQTVPVNLPAQGSPRPVPTALGVFSTAPAGSLQGLVIQGPQEVLAGLGYSYQVKGYDQYFNPVAVAPGEVSWTLKQVSGRVEQGIFRPAEGGEAVLEASVQGVRQEYRVRVIGPQELAGLRVNPGVIRVAPGEKVSLEVEVEGRDGRVWHLPYGEVHWEVEGKVGTVANGCFQAAGGDASGKLRVSFQGLSQEIPVTVGSPVPPDVAGHWAEECVGELLRRGILHGYPDGLFRPDRPVTRGELAAMLAGAFNWQAASGVSLPFKDELPDWALPGIRAAWSHRVVTGYPDGTFRPGQPVTRSELAVMLEGALQIPATSESLAFKDAARIPVWAQEAVLRLAAAGIVRGSDGYFRPAAPATRAEVAALLWQALNHNP